MASLYYYDKYNTNTSESSWVNGSAEMFTQVTVDLPAILTTTVYSGYHISNAEYVGTGQVERRTADGLGGYYEVGWNSVLEFREVIREWVQFSNEYSVIMGYEWTTRTKTLSQSRGSFIETIVAEEGAYPINGWRRADGYWYVRGEPLLPEIWTKVGGTYRSLGAGSAVKINNVFREISDVFVKINGVYRKS